MKKADRQAKLATHNGRAAVREYAHRDLHLHVALPCLQPTTPHQFFGPALPNFSSLFEPKTSTHLSHSLNHLDLSCGLGKRTACELFTSARPHFSQASAPQQNLPKTQLSSCSPFVSTMARIQLTPPGTPDLSWSPSSSTGKGPFFFPASLRSRRFLCGLIGLVGGCALLVTLIHIDSTSYLDRVSQSSKAQLDRVWQQIGALDTLDSVTQPCERTLLWKFSGKSGFGSEYGMFLR